MTNTHNIGFIGGGMISQVAHLPFYTRDKRIKIKSIAEPRPSLRNILATRFKIDEIYDHHSNIINDPSIDTVIIIAPRPATGPLVLQALEAGKTVITEKPAAHTTEQITKQIDAIRHNGQHFHVGYMKRYDAGIKHAKMIFTDLLASECLGTLLHVNFFNYAKHYAHPIPEHVRPSESRTSRFETWPTSPKWLPHSERELFEWHLNSGIHDINLIRHFFGNDIDVAHATKANNNSIITTLINKNILINYNFVSSSLGKWFQGAEFIFEKGRLLLDIPSPMDATKITNIHINSEHAMPSRFLNNQPSQVWCFEAQAEHFKNCILNKLASKTSGKDSKHDHILFENIWSELTKAQK